MDPAEASQILEEVIQEYYRANILDPFFPKQTEFILDDSRLKTLWCTRRAAKSYTAGLNLFDTAQKYDNCNCLYLGLTRLSAKGIIWKDVLEHINRKHDLKAEFNKSELTATLPNGSVIYVTGVDSTEDEMQKLLGKKWKLVIIDEAQSFTIDQRNLVYGILGPAMIDVDGTICMMGTAGNYTRGLFFDITNKKEPGWKLFQWTAHDNPYVAKNWQAELDKIDRERPLFKQTKLYQQWYLNKWVVDEDKLVYKFNYEKNIFDELPKTLHPEGWTFVLGIDLGWEDDSAFVLGAFHANDPCLYVCATFNKSKMPFDHADTNVVSVVGKIKEFMNVKDMAPCKVIIDGAAKQGVETMKQRSTIPFEYADKQGKVDFIEVLNSDLIQSNIKIHRSCTNLIDEMAGLTWFTKMDQIVYPKKEHPDLPNHLCDAFLYMWRNGYHYMFEPKKKQLVVGSREWHESTTNDIWEKEREAMINKQSGEWPSDE